MYVSCSTSDDIHNYVKSKTRLSLALLSWVKLTKVVTYLHNFDDVVKLHFGCRSFSSNLPKGGNYEHISMMAISPSSNYYSKNDITLLSHIAERDPNITKYHNIT